MVDDADLGDPDTFQASVMERCQPAFLPGAARRWSMIGEDGLDRVVAALKKFDAQRSADLFVGEPSISARYYYDETLTGFNFTRRSMLFGDALDQILATAGQSDHPSLYMGSLPTDAYLPGIEEHTRLAFVPPHVKPLFWIGHASSVACHYDTMDNVACVAAGRRRFTLFPPDSISDLYVGPIDHTLAGQPISLAMGSDPGDPRFPRFDEAARARAQVFELRPGDALYIPKLWWHQVEALDDVNVLVNFWWDGFATGPDRPSTAMMLALIAIADRPPAERAAWRAFFDHYVFRPNGHPLAFLPEEHHGILSASSKENYGRIRSMVMRMLRS